MPQRLIITFSDEEQRALENLARAELRPVRDQLRLLVREEAKRRGVWSAGSPAASSAAARRTRKGAGNG